MSTIPLLSDREVLDRLRPAETVALMAEALVANHRGTLTAPARTWVDLDSARFAFTAGALAGSVSGFRVYGGWGPTSDQFTAVWGPDGQLRGLVVGSALGSARTGALGGAAVDALARAESARVGVIGSGTVAWWQLWATVAVRDVTEVRVFSPTRQRREAFASRGADELGVVVRAVDSAHAAVEGADIVIVSTTARTPVIETEWIAPGTHVTSTGPKYADGAELPLDLVERAMVVVSDSPQQAHGDRENWFSARPVEHLGAVIAGDLDGRRGANDVTLYCSTGLAGTEVILGNVLLCRAP